MCAFMKEIDIGKFRGQFSNSPARFAWVQANLCHVDAVRELLSAVDDGPYSLPQWVDAFIAMEQWLDTQGKRASWEAQLGYVHCACDAVGAGANLTPLSGILSDMLDDYGFEQAAEK
jgi:hypothetical protein